MEIKQNIENIDDFEFSFVDLNMIQRKNIIDKTPTILNMINSIGHILREYLGKSMNNLLISNKLIYISFFQKFRFIFLSQINSMKYIFNDEFREFIHSMIIKPHIQIGLYFGRSCNMNALNSLMNVYKLHISFDILNRNQMINFKIIKDVKFLKFNGIDINLNNISDISSSLYSIDFEIIIIEQCNILMEKLSLLPDLRCLKLNHFRGDILSMKSFERLISLSLNGCDHITDASELGNIKRLDLSGCQNLNKIPDVCNNDFLDINTSGIVTINSVFNTKKLNITNCNSLMSVIINGSINELYGYRCQFLRKVIINNKVSNVNFSTCRSLREMIINGKVSYLLVDECPKIKDFSTFKGICTINLSRTSISDKDIVYLSESSYLDLSYSKITSCNLYLLQKVKKLILNYCSNIQVIHTLPCILSISATHCKNLLCVHRLSNMISLNLHCCKKLQNVTIANIERVTLNDCISLVTINVQNVNILNLSGCHLSNLDFLEGQCFNRINLSNSPNINNDCLEKLIMAKEIDIHNCNSITDISCLQYAYHLEALSIKNCKNIRDLFPVIMIPNIYTTKGNRIDNLKSFRKHHKEFHKR